MLGAADVEPAVVVDAAHVHLDRARHRRIVDDGHNAVAGEVGAGLLDDVGIGTQQDDVLDAVAGVAAVRCRGDGGVVGDDGGGVGQFGHVFHVDTEFGGAVP